MEWASRDKVDLHLILMRLFNKIFSWIDNQRIIFYIFVVLISLPNFVLFYTERMPLLVRVSNLVLPFAVFWYLFTLTKKPGKMFWILFLFIFYDAFQIVLLYLFGESVIAVDMFLNVVTTNSVEIEELLGNLLPALVIVFTIYGGMIVLAIRSLMNKEVLSDEFRKAQRRRSLVFMACGAVLVLCSFCFSKGFSLHHDIYPVNVAYNMCLAIDRQISNNRYFDTSKDFTFGARAEHRPDEREIYVLVIGETARADNFGIYGYGRNTTPNLLEEKSIAVVRDALTESNTTHKSVPMLLSAVSAEHFGDIYSQKSIITAFKEAGFYTMFISNQRPNHSFIDFFGSEANYATFIKEDLPTTANVLDEAMLNIMAKQLAEAECDKVFVVLHTYGSHFNYKERYTDADACFKPDTAMEAKFKNRDMLVNAYDNSIRYTDKFLGGLIKALREYGGKSVLAYTSDHGEDIFDDERKLFLHASPIPSYYQLRVPLVLWASDGYVERYGDVWNNVLENCSKPVSVNKNLFHTLLSLGGISTDYRIDSLSLASPSFKPTKRYYLNDHNEAIGLESTGMGELDIRMFEKNGLQYP